MIHLFSKPPTCTSVVRQRVSKCLNTGVSKVRSKPVSSHLLYRRVNKIRQSVSPIPSTARLTTTTARKAWCLVTSSKASVPWSIAVLRTIRSTTGKVTTRWSMVITTVSLTSTYTVRPSILPTTMPRRTMHSSRVHVRVTSLLLTPYSPLPPEAKLLQVTVSVTVLAVVPHLSLGRWRPRLWTGRSIPLLLGNPGCGSRERIEGIPQLIGLWNPNLLLWRCFWLFFQHILHGVNK